MKLRTLMGSVAVAGAAAMYVGTAAAEQVIEVYKSEFCGCCGAWVDHLKEAGFSVKVNNVPNTADYRQKFGIPEKLGSCHTATVSGYALEGHVPAADIKRLLKEKPMAKGLAVPGMPMGSPGMEGDRTDAYDVVLVRGNGKHSVYQHHPAK